MPASVTDPDRARRALVRGPRRDPSLLVRLAAVLAVLGFSLALPSPAYAHTELTSSSPADGATVSKLPTTVELTFSDAIATSAYVVVTDPSGAQVSVGQPDVDDAVVRQQTAGGASAGEYTVDYRVVSADGHAVSGDVTFTLTAKSAGRPKTPESTGRPTSPESAESAESDPSAAADQSTGTDGFWDEHWQSVVLGGGGLLAGVAVLGTGLRARR